MLIVNMQYPAHQDADFYNEVIYCLKVFLTNVYLTYAFRKKQIR